MKTDTSEKGLEALIVGDMTSAGWLAGSPKDYDRAYGADLAQLRAFVAATQPALVEAFDLDIDSPARQKFLARLQGEITKRGVIDVLRKPAEPARAQDRLLLERNAHHEEPYQHH